MFFFYLKEKNMYILFARTLSPTLLLQFWRYGVFSSEVALNTWNEKKKKLWKFLLAEVSNMQRTKIDTYNIGIIKKNHKCFWNKKE